MSGPCKPTENAGPSRLGLTAAALIAGICMPGCSLISSSSGSGAGSASVGGSVTPDAAPVGTAGDNQTATLSDSTVVTGTAVVGETVPTQDASATATDGTDIEVRHGFFPGDQPSTPAGAG